MRFFLTATLFMLNNSQLSTIANNALLDKSLEIAARLQVSITSQPRHTAPPPQTACTPSRFKYYINYFKFNRQVQPVLLFG